MSKVYDSDTLAYLRAHGRLPDKWYVDHGIEIPKRDVKKVY